MSKLQYDCTVKESYIAYKAICEEKHKSDSFEELRLRKFAIESEIQHKPNGIIDCVIQVIAFPISIIAATLAAMWGAISSFVGGSSSALISTSAFDTATDEAKSQMIEAASELIKTLTDGIVRNYFAFYLVVAVACALFIVGKYLSNNKEYKMRTMMSLELEVVNQRIIEIDNQAMSTTKPEQRFVVSVRKICHKLPKTTP